MNTKTLITEAVSLPVEERVILVDSLLKSINQPEAEIDRKWAVVAKRRLNELKSGQTKPISGKQVFSKIWARFDK